MNDSLIRMLQLGKKGYNCSQIIMLLGLDARGETNPQLVRAMSGLAYGCGSGSGTCGVLTGGCCLISLYVGKGSDEEDLSDRLDLMLQELNDWFASHTGCDQGNLSCDIILGDAEPVVSRQRCGNLLAETYAKVMEILTANDVDLNPI